MADLNALLKQANDADTAKDFSTAVRLYDEIIPQASPEFFGKLQLYKGVSLFNSGDFAKAIIAFDEAIGSADESIRANALGCKARALERSGKHEEACKVYEECMKIDTKREHVKWVDYAHACNQSNQYELALDIAAKGLEEQPEQFEKLHNERIFAFFKLKKPMESLDDIEAVLAQKQMGELRAEEVELYTEVLAQRGHEYLQEGKYEDALKYFHRVHDATRSANSKFLIGIAHLRKHEDAEAKKWLEDAVEADPGNWKHHVALGTIFMRPDTSDFAKASEQFEIALHSGNPEAQNANVHFNNGFALMKLNREKEAKPSLQFVYENDKTNWIAPALLGTVVLNEASYEQAIELLTHAINVSNGEADDTVYYNLAYAYMMLGRNRQAAEFFKKAMDRNPSNKAAATAYGRMLEDIKTEEDRLKKAKEEEERQEKERQARAAEAERQRIAAEEQAKAAARERDAKKRKEAEQKAQEEKARIAREAEMEKERIAEEARVRKIKIQEAKERRLKRLKELQVMIGGPQHNRARRPSLDLIPQGNTGKNAHAYVDWYNEKVVHSKDEGVP